jgi:hypothetical protein
MRQPGSQFWGTGMELSQIRDTLDPIQAKDFLVALSTRLFGDTYDYSKIEFRSLNHNVVLIVRATGEEIVTTPFRHLMTEDGRGY